MGLMSFLFPDVEMARREALARIDMLRRQMDDAYAAEQPIRDLIDDVLPLMRKAEEAGERLTVVEVPRERQLLVTRAKMESDAISGRPVWTIDNRPATLFGLTVIDGPELRVR